MIVRELLPFEMPSCLPGGREFIADSNLPKGFDLDEEYFVRRWSDLIASGNAMVFGLFKDDNTLAGALAWKVFDGGDFNQKRYAVESFWFVHKEHRGRGVLLFNAFDDWCQSNGVNFGMMIRLSSSEVPDTKGRIMSESLDALYRNKGYQEVERVSIKEFNP